MKLQRLFEMGPAELAFRGRQEVFKAVERLSVSERRQGAVCRFDRSAADEPIRRLLDRLDGENTSGARGELQHLLQDRMRRRFFAGLQEDWNGADLAPRLERTSGFDVQRLLARADAVCRGEFEILGYGALSFGAPVNWRLDPVSGRESPAIHWSRLDPLAPDAVGDSKVVWELNRHQWLLDLGQAYRLTGDDRYAACFVSLVSDWMRRNPYARGINWSSALEVAMRLLSWCWALNLFGATAALTPVRFQEILGWLQRHAVFVERYQSRYFAPNTHLTVEALALYTIGTLLPELEGARRWRAIGRRLLLEQLPLQVSEDGVYFEQSTRYQYYTVEIYLHFAILADRNGDSLPSIVNQRLARMLHFLIELRRPDGTLPQIGDTDGGWLCPLVHREVGDYRGLFSTAALWLRDPQLAWAAGSPAHESFCLLGAGTAAEWQSLSPEAPPLRRVSSQGAGEYVVMRNGWDRDGHQLIFDTGPLGCHVCGGHGHADLLAVQCSAYGENYLVDPGTGCYTTGSAWREYFRSTRAHSTLRVDGLDQAATAGPFSWRERPAARLLAYGTEPGDGTPFAVAEHDGYARLADPVKHRRRVWFLDGAAWLIVDELFGGTPHGVELRFQFAPLPVKQEEQGWVRARGRSSSLLLKTFASVELKIELAVGGRQPLQGWFSPNYGRRIPAPTLVVAGEGRLPLRFATLVYPSRNKDAAPPVVEPRFREASLASLSISDPALAVPDFEAEMASVDPGAGPDPEGAA